MSIGVGLIMMAELAAAGWVIWGFMHEDRLIAWEKRQARRLKKWLGTKLRARKYRQCRKLAEDGIYAVMRHE